MIGALADIREDDEIEEAVDALLDSLGITDSADYAFCPTGAGGGIDNSCPPGEGQAGPADRAKEIRESDRQALGEKLAADKAGAVSRIDALATKLVESGVVSSVAADDGEDDEIIPDSWDTLSSDQQFEAESKWKADNFNSAYDSEVESWWENSASEDAKGDIFTQDKWAAEKLVEIMEGNGVDFEKSGLLNEKGEVDDDKLLGELWSGGGNSDDWDYKTGDLKDSQGLINPEILGQLRDAEGKALIFTKDENQMEFPVGLPEGAPPLEQAWTQNVLGQMEKAMSDKIDDAADWMQAPDASYFTESVDGYLSESWHNNDDDYKFGFAQTALGLEEKTPTAPGKIRIPGTFDIDDDSSEDYRATRALANTLTVARFKEIANEKGVDLSHGQAQNLIGQIWGDWKGDSAKGLGFVLQSASADEFGSNFYETRGSEKTKDWAINYQSFAKENVPGGYETAKAYVRAQWEVTQYVMEKAGVEHLDLYRSILMDSNLISAYSQTTPAGTALPKLSIKQNGAASFTENSSIANSWGGVGYKPANAERVVIRARIPSSAILSLPVYGKNLHNEKEVVVMGLPWKSWDAWHKEAPSFDSFPLDSKRTKDGFYDFADQKKAA